ncbi:hypothetical protein ONO86_00698 [Micromonospora noduli]|nr:hypothetical protein ONO86_00698 [Micromonospora noduli]
MVTRLSLRWATAQDRPAANSYSVLSAASAPLFSPPCTFAVTQTMAGLSFAVRAAVRALVRRGSRRSRMSSAISRSAAGRTWRSLDTTAYGNGWPSTLLVITPVTTRLEARSTAPR